MSFLRSMRMMDFLRKPKPFRRSCRPGWKKERKVKMKSKVKSQKSKLKNRDSTKTENIQNKGFLLFTFELIPQYNHTMHPVSKAIRTQAERTNEMEHSSPLFLTSSFCFDNAEE